MSAAAGGGDGDLPDDLPGVLEALDAATDQARTEASPLGYFAAMYRVVTAKVAEGVRTGFFDDDARMERLDVVFANRYLDALAARRAGRSPTRSWATSFDAAGRATPIALQHLLVGMNAHINLDLGVAAAEVAPGDELPGLRRDFDRINEILASTMATVQERLARISPWLGLLDTVGGRRDDVVVRFSIEVARTRAWRFATELAPLERDAWRGPLGARDAAVARLGRRILRPGALTVPVWLIRLRESRDVRRNIDVLAGVEAPDLAEVEARVRSERAG